MPKCSVTIITLNEAAHIGAAIDSVAWADEVLVVDCGSADATTEIARAKGATVVHRDWSGWIDQKNFAAERAANDWIFSLDADERVTPELSAEILALLKTDPAVRGYRMPRVSYYLGRERLIPTLPRRSSNPEIGSMARWRKKLFVLMSQNARSATEFFGIPPNRVIELGTQIEF